jgi:transcriptional regulator with XRE-family HTH domain
MPKERENSMQDQQKVPTYMVDIDQIRAYIRALMAEKKVTVAKLAEITNVTRGTLDNFFDGTTKAPTFDKVCTIIAKLGGSVDVAIGLKREQTVHAQQDIAPILEAHREAMTAKNETIADLKSEVADLKQELADERQSIRLVSKWQKLFVLENIALAALFVVIAITLIIK